MKVSKANKKSKARALKKRDATSTPSKPRWDRKEGARYATTASVPSALVVEAFQVNLVDEAGGDFTPTVSELAAELTTQAQAVKDGDLSKAEMMLMCQAVALQAIFSRFSLTAKKVTDIHHIQALLGLALKAQSQCRATLQTLVEVKYPRQVQFVRQQNIAGGHQQVNNNAPGARVENLKSSTELLRGNHGGSLEQEAPAASVAAHPPLAAVASIDRAADTRREGPREDERAQARSAVG